jgi:Trypsin
MTTYNISNTLLRPTLQRTCLAAGTALVLPALMLLVGACQGASLGTITNDNTNANTNANTNTNANDTADGGVDPDADLCGVGDDEKVVSAAPKIWNGTAEPEQCLSPGQKLAVGALNFQSYGWTNGCTGTLINSDTVLTAAHCVQRWDGSLINANSVRFAVGTNALAPVHSFNVTAVYSHPDYNSGGDATHDIGLLKLSEPITAAGVTLLPIPVNRADLPTSLLGQDVQNCGFGETEVSQDNALLFWTVEELTDIHPGWFTVYGGGSPNGSSVCFGDSGGPSFYLFDGRNIALLGTVSWGNSSCMDYDHFARADDSLPWIEQYSGALDPCVGITAAGICDGDGNSNVALWCDNGQLRQQCCDALGSTCATDASGNNRCGNTCGGVTFEGECQGNDAVWCDNGVLKRRRCEPCDQICARIDNVMGYYCVDP